jgi:hypothetical protein
MKNEISPCSSANPMSTHSGRCGYVCCSSLSLNRAHGHRQIAPVVDSHLDADTEQHQEALRRLSLHRSPRLPAPTTATTSWSISSEKKDPQHSRIDIPTPKSSSRICQTSCRSSWTSGASATTSDIANSFELIDPTVE